MNFSKLEALIDTMPQRGIPACDLAVTFHGEPVFRRMAGFKDSSGTKPVSANDLYWIFSCSKITTCTAAMRLVEEGKLHLDDPVSKYIPAYANLFRTDSTSDVPIRCKNVMTVEHLFTMQGGMGYNLNSLPILRAIEAGKNSTLELVSAMADIPLKFEPGTHYRYSLCHDVLAAVVEVISGMRFSDYVRQLIFDPLGMTSTGFRPTEQQMERFGSAYTYQNHLGRACERELANRYNLMSPNYDSGGAGLFSSVDDYLKLLTTLALGGTSKDGYQLLKPETVAMMEVNRLGEASLKDFVVNRLYGYGWGLCGRVHTNPACSLSRSPVGEFGWDGAEGAFAVVDPKNEVAAYFGMQVGGCQYAYQVLHPLMRNYIYEGLGI